MGESGRGQQGCGAQAATKGGLEPIHFVSLLENGKVPGRL
jgi:hypothetical protein